MPSVSIIVPIYNSEDTIGECIRSIVSQSFTDIEIILVNDGSTDKCKEICDEYAQKDARIRVFYQENKGRSAARLNGFIHSTGEWIAFVDSDDTIPNDAIERLYNSTSDNTDIVFGNGYSLANEKRKVIPIEDFRHLAVRAEGTIGVPWGSLYRKTLLSEYSFDIPRDIYNGEDYIFWLRTIFNTEKPVNIIYESVYNKGKEHTSNCFKWTADYCYKLNEYRRNSIPSDKHEKYMSDMISDRMVNMYSVAVDTPKQEWENSKYYKELLSDMRDNDMEPSSKQRLFFLLPSRWMRKSFSCIGNIIRNKYYIFLIIAGLAMLLLNFLDTQTLSDDLVYRFVFQEDVNNEPQIFNNIGDFFKSQYEHYFHINGRAVIQTIAQVFLVFTPAFFYNIVNSILFVLMIHLCIVFIRIKESYRLFAAVIICFLLFVVFAGVRTTLLWSLGIFYYQWVVVITLSFLLLIRKLDDKIKPVYLLLAPLSLFVGWTHESLSLPISITIIIYIIVNRKNILKRSIILFLLWYVIGTILCVFAPSILNRADGGITLFSRILSGVLNFTMNVRITWLLFITLIITRYKYKNIFENEIKTHWYYYITIVLCLGIVFLCGTSIERVAFYADFISMLLWVSLLTRILSKRSINNTIVICSGVLFIFFVFAVIVRKESFDNWQHITKQMEKPGQEIISVRQPEKGRSRIMDFFREHYVNPSVEFGYYCVYMAFNTNDINTRLAAALYGKKSMVFIPEDIINHIKNDSNAYINYDLDLNKDLYVWRLKENRNVKRIIFKLKPEETSKLLPHQKLVVYRDNEYIMDDKFHYSVVLIDNNPYLIFTCPTTNIYRRIDTIQYEYE